MKRKRTYKASDLPKVAKSRLATEKRVQRMLDGLGREMARKIRKDLATRRSDRARTKALQRSLFKSLHVSPAASVTVRPRRPSTMYTASGEALRLTASSLGGVRVIPQGAIINRYDYAWTWVYKYRDVYQKVQAVKGKFYKPLGGNTGNLSFSQATDRDGWCEGAVMAGVGIHVQPTKDGTLVFEATASIRYWWNTLANFSSVHSDGWIGLYAAQMWSTSTGTLPIPPFAQVWMLWSQNIWLGGGVQGPEEHELELPLMITVPATAMTQYALFVFCGGRVWADGFNSLNLGGSARSDFRAGVREMGWAVV